MEFYMQQLNDYRIIARQQGLTKKDYYELKKSIYEINQRIQEISSHLKKWETERKLSGIEAMENRPLFPRKNVIATMESWKDEILMYREIQIGMWQLAYGIEKNVIGESFTHFALRNASLLHLIYTNDTFKKIKLHSLDSYLFLCQEHLEEKPSLSVCSSSNSSFCYGCGTVRNPLSYLSFYEGISGEEAMELLRNIYLIHPTKEIKNQSLIDKYRESLFSEEYFYLLEAGMFRTSTKEDSYRKRYALIRYREHLSTINRVKEGIALSYQDSAPKQKVYHLPDKEE